MTDIIHLKNEDITKELFDRAKFIFWAAGGAMGDGGAVYVVGDGGKSYYCNCAYGDYETGYVADYRLVAEACPMIEEGEIPEGWVYHYLGAGNNLVYRSEYDGEYCRILDELIPSKYEIEYQAWQDIAVKLCSKVNG